MAETYLQEHRKSKLEAGEQVSAGKCLIKAFHFIHRPVGTINPGELLVGNNQPGKAGTVFYPLMHFFLGWSQVGRCQGNFYEKVRGKW